MNLWILFDLRELGKGMIVYLSQFLFCFCPEFLLFWFWLCYFHCWNCSYCEIPGKTWSENILLLHFLACVSSIVADRLWMIMTFQITSSILFSNSSIEFLAGTMALLKLLCSLFKDFLYCLLSIICQIQKSPIW